MISERFEILEVGGSGGMGTVYRASDLVEGGDVALKVLRAPRAGTEHRFLREANVLATLNHPALARYVAHGSTPAGERYIAMEWFDGAVLSAHLAVGPLSLADTITVGTRVAGALAVAHGQGIVHRDVKPDNILLKDGRFEHAKVIDFGIARLSDQDRVTQVGSVLGTPRYMSPEQARGDEHIDARADVFSLGCILFACATGRPAFTGSDARAVLAKILLEPAPRVRDLCPEVPEALDSLIAAMLSKEPEQRPSNCEMVAHALLAISDLETATLDGACPKSAGLGYGEQRLTCLVFVTGALGAGDGPDETVACTDRETSGPASAVRAAARVHGGHIDSLADGSCVVTLPGTDAPRAQATRAALCALAIREVAPGARMALATIRRDTSDRPSLGDMIDRAAEVLKSDAPGDTDLAWGEQSAIRVDAISADLLGERFDIVPCDHWLELRAERERIDITRTLLGRPTPCVGRTRELGILDAIFEDCVEELAPRAVLIRGAPGMGKSRIRYEFLRRLAQRDEPVQVLIGRGDPIRAGAAFGLLGQAIRHAAGVRSGEEQALARAKIRERVGREIEDEQERAHIVEFLGELVGVPFPAEGRVQLRAARHDASLKGEQMRRAWEDWLSAECDAMPVVLVLEDLHWGDWPTVKFIDSALRNLTEKPFMVLALARPSVEQMLPKLWEGRGVMEIELTPLSRRASEKLVNKALGPDLDPAVATRLAEKAGGNAFFLEELIRVTVEGKDDALPDSVLAVVQAKLDRLPAQARLVLRAASVFGGKFWLRGLTTLVARELDGGDLDDWVRYLVDREVITQQRHRRFPDEEEYVFRHSLVREAVYETLTDVDRQTGHQLAAAWLRGVGEADAVVLAGHHERGGEPGEAAGLYRRACEQALEGGDLAAAISRATSGSACLERSNVDDPVLGGALCMLHGRALGWKGQFEDALQLVLDALGRLEPGTDLWCEAAAEVANASGTISDHERLIAVADQLIALAAQGLEHRAYVMAAATTASQLLFSGRYELAGRLLEHIDQKPSAFLDDDPGVAAAIYRVLGVRAICAGDLVAGLENKSASVTAYEQAGDHPMAQQQRGNLGSVYIGLGAYQEAEGLLREAVARADAMELPSVAGLCRLNLASACVFQDKVEAAHEILAQAVAAFDSLNEQRMVALARAEMSYVLLRQGQLDAAEAEANLGLEMSQGTPPCVAYSLAKLTQVLLAKGDAPAALRAAREAMDILEATGGLDEGEALVRLLYAEALHKAGQPEDARAAIAAAHARMLEVGGKISETSWRTSFLERVPENRRTQELFDELVGS